MQDENRFLDKQGRLQQWPSKHTDKLLVLAYLATKFDLKLTYSETEVNALLKQWHTFSDWALLRRELFDRGFIVRNPDGTDYRLKQIKTELSDLILVGPNILTDPEVAVPWLEGEAGRDTLRLMGSTEEHNKPSTINEEEQRVRSFVTSTNQRTWMLNYQDKTVGAIWVDLKLSDYLSAPSIHLMIGDPKVRGFGIGRAAVLAVINLLSEEGTNKVLYSRHLVENLGSAKLLAKIGFTKAGDAYYDSDGLEFQNVLLKLDEVVVANLDKVEPV